LKKKGKKEKGEKKLLQHTEFDKIEKKSEAVISPGRKVEH